MKQRREFLCLLTSVFLLQGCQPGVDQLPSGEYSVYDFYCQGFWGAKPANKALVERTLIPYQSFLVSGSEWIDYWDSSNLGAEAPIEVIFHYELKKSGKRSFVFDAIKLSPYLERPEFNRRATHWSYDREVIVHKNEKIMTSDGAEKELWTLEFDISERETGEKVGSAIGMSFYKGEEDPCAGRRLRVVYALNRKPPCRVTTQLNLKEMDCKSGF